MINIDIEASVIGGLLISGYTPDANEVLAIVDPDAFTVSLYRETFKEIKRQASTRGLIDSLMIAEAMGEGNFSNIIMTTKSCPSAANLKGYAQVVSKYHLIRQFSKLMETNYDSITQSNNYEQALAGIEAFMTKVNSMGRPSTEIIPTHIDELLESYADVLERRLKNGEASDTLKTGIDELDEITGGLNPEDLMIVAARPGMGKTELALKIAEGVADSYVTRGDIVERRGVLIFSMEMSAHQVIERSIAGASNMPVSSLRKPSRMGDEDWARISQGIGMLKGLDVWVVDASKLNVEQMRSIAERHKQRHPALSLILADYLGLISKPKAERNDLAIAHITGSLKAMAKDLKTPVICLSQLSRDVEKRPAGQRRPTNADLRDSGSIEQDADTIVMLYREAVYNEDSPAAPYGEIIVTKNRFGTLGTVYQLFKNGHFLPTDQESAHDICKGKASAAPQGRKYGRDI